MLAIERQNSGNRKVYVRIILAALISALIMFSEPILAQRSRRENRQSNRSSQKQQQVTKSSPAPRRQSSSSAGRVSRQNRVRSITPNSNAPQSRSIAPGLTHRRNIQAKSQPSVQQPNNMTNSRLNTLQPGAGPNAQNPSLNSLSTTGSTNVNSGQGKQTTNSAGMRIGLERISHIGGIIGNRKEPSSPTNRSMASLGLPTAELRSSIGSLLGGKKTNTSVNAGQSRSGTNTRTGTTGWSRIGSRIIGRRSSATTETQILSKTRAASVGKLDAINNSTLSRNRSAAAATGARRGILGRLGFSKKQQNSDAKILDESGTAGRSDSRNTQSRRAFNEESDRIRSTREFSQRQPAGSVRAGRYFDRADGIRSQRSGGGERAFRPRYHDRPQLVRHENSNVYVYRDRIAGLRYRMVRPTTRYIVSYDRGWDFTFGCFYPYYHRKYVFVSLGGYWPLDYSCIRYYWYGWHPYYWYGYYPLASEVQGDTYNYYTYNYYGTDDNTAAAYSQDEDYIQPVDHNTFADVREKLAQQQAEVPDEPTLADSYFESGVEAFENGNFNIAAEWFAEAIVLAPDDMILPYAYCQALFANLQYSEASEVLRAALKDVDPEKEGVFYPRGLYADDEVLFGQIDRLKDEAEILSYDADLQLLLGYQLLGIDELDEAAEPLLFASQDPVNANAALKLIELLEKMRNSEAEGEDIGYSN
jgi:hypothetical protein